MIMKLIIKNISNEKEKIMAQYIRDTVDGFINVIHILDELGEYEEFEEDDNK